MTEQEWVNSTELRPMLEFLRRKASRRKMRLFGVACCRSIWHLLSDERSRKAVEVVERFADGMASEEELNLNQTAAYAAVDDSTCALAYDAAKAVHAVIHDYADEAEDFDGVQEYAADAAYAYGKTERGAEELRQIGAFREIIGNPFRHVVIDPVWLAWNDRTVRRIAQAIYDERAFERMPILADALEDAGCDNADILNHCRGEGSHVRGCWVVDLLIGRE